MRLEFVVPAEAFAGSEPEAGGPGGDACIVRSVGTGASSSASADRRMLTVVGELVQDVRERLGVHQAMFDGDVEQLLGNREGVDGFADLAAVALDLIEAGPIGGLVFGQLAGRRVDAEREELVERGMKRRAIQA